MNKSYQYGLAVVIIIIVLGAVFIYNRGKDKPDPTGLRVPDVRNIAYTIGNETFTLVNGRAEKEAAPGSAAKNTLTVFGEPVYGDFNGDKLADAAVLLENNPGGSGTFYYAVLAINTGAASKATNAVLLGDRIAPQTVEIKDGRVVYNFAQRKPGEPMTAQSSVGKSVYINYDQSTGMIAESSN